MLEGKLANASGSQLGASSTFILATMNTNHHRLVDLSQRLMDKTNQMLGSPPPEPVGRAGSPEAMDSNQPVDGVVGEMARIALTQTDLLNDLGYTLARLEREL